MFSELFDVITKIVALDDEEKVLCESFFEPFDARRNTILEDQGKTPRYLYFLKDGFMRLFYYNETEDEVTTYLAEPNGFIASFLSFIHKKPSSENVECITDCQLLRISRLNLETLVAKSENFKKFSLVIFEKVIAVSQIRANGLATLTAELRYKKMLAEQPQLLQNIPVQYIASF